MNNKEWCFDHGEFTDTSMGCATRYINDDTVGVKYTVKVVEGRLVLRVENDGREPYERVLDSGEVFFIHLRHRKRSEYYS